MTTEEELRELRAWKESAMDVLSRWHETERVLKEIGLPPRLGANLSEEVCRILRDHAIAARPKVLTFARIMEAKLAENDHKRHWNSCAVSYLLQRLRDEVVEVEVAVRNYQVAESTQKGREVARECADAANFALMIADNCGGLRK